MKKIDQKGFTLVELLAVIAILSVIMLIAVPNVIGIIDKNKKETYVADAKQMITLAEYQFRSNKINLDHILQNGEAALVRLSCLDTSDLKEGPDGGTYDKTLSFVLIGRASDTYYYYATIRENVVSKESRGLPLLSRSVLNQDGAINRVEKPLASLSLSKNSTWSDGSGKSYRIVSVCEM